MAKKKRKAVKKEEPFFVGITDPIGIRRSVLEASKDLLHYMSRFEKFKNVRNEKAEHIARLKDVTAEIAKLVNKLRKTLPQTKIRARLHEHEKRLEAAAVKKEKVKKEKQARLSAKPKAPRKSPATDLEKLEAELGAIEKRLTKMT